MTAFLVAVVGGYGTFLLYTALALRWRGLGPGPRPSRASRLAGQPKRRPRPGDWLAQAGLPEVRPVEFLAATAAVGGIGAVAGLAVFAGMLPAVAVGIAAAAVPFLSYRAQRRTRMAKAQEAWPRMLEEIRLLTGSLGRSIPQAVLDTGRRGPEELRPAFEAAEREWRLSTDFARVITVLKTQLADPTADAACETLLTAHQLGGTGIDRRLEALIDDRLLEVQGRKDALAKQAGVRFARRFVLVVPAGMALVGLSIGTGRDAYRTTGGQLAVVGAIALVALCWAWAGVIMRLPRERRVFTS